MSKTTVVFDIETHGSELIWDMPPEEFFRLGGYSLNRGPVVLTTDLDEMRRVIRSADLISGHNIHSFDLTAIFGKDSDEPLRMALDGRIVDTWTHATLWHPAPTFYHDRNGRKRFPSDPDKAKHWFSLDNQCFQLGLPGKVEDLKALAKKYGGFGMIPVDDPEYCDYLRGDVDASVQLVRALLGRNRMDAYSRREQINAAIDAQNSRNGWRVDQDAARARVAHQEYTRKRYMTLLVDEYGMPTEGKMPLRSKAGKEAIFAALESVGIQKKDLPKTATGNPSLSGDGIVAAAEGRSDAAQELAGAIAQIGGLRPLAEQALNYVTRDGRVHPSITTLQRSGRKSTTQPGLTTWTSRGPGAVEKSYFLPNAEDERLLAFDFSQADARILAALSGDGEFAKRFAPDVDAHLLTAWAVWGRDEVGEDRKDPKTEAYRNTAKAMGHAYGYGAGAPKLAAMSGQPLDVARQFVQGMRSTYRGVSRWTSLVVHSAEVRGYLTSFWGRKMLVDKGREFTQGPALLGQNGTREIVVDGLIKIARTNLAVIRCLVAQVHDEVIFSFPVDKLEEYSKLVVDCMETTWQPPDGTGQAVHFPLSAGKPAKNWMEANH